MTRPRKLHDSAMPAANSVSALNLLRLADITLKLGYRKQAKAQIGRLLEQHQNRLTGGAFLFQAVDYLLDDSKEIAIVGVDDGAHSKELVARIQQLVYNPNKVIAILKVGEIASKDIGLLSYKKMIGGKATAYVCIETVCKLPTNKIHKAAELAEATKKYRIK